MGKVNEIYGTADEMAYADTDSVVTPTAIEPNTPTTSGKTPNYGLPQWAGSDITDWFELNPAFEKIDEVMHANATAAETAQATGDSNTTAISNLTQSLNNTISRVTDVENVNTQQSQQITLNVTHLNEHDTAIQALQTAQAAMNETLEEVSGEAATSTADITDLKQRVQVAEGNISTNADSIGNMSALETSDKSSLVAALNELASEGIATGGVSDQYVGIAGQNGQLAINGAHPITMLLDISYTGVAGGITPQFDIDIVNPLYMMQQLVKESLYQYEPKEVKTPTGISTATANVFVVPRVLVGYSLPTNTVPAYKQGTQYDNATIQSVGTIMKSGLNYIRIVMIKAGGPATEGTEYHFLLEVRLYNIAYNRLPNVLTTMSPKAVSTSLGGIRVQNLTWNGLSLGNPLIQ